ncbi:FUSC family protein [Demequina subtropica]|uniref:FUSC family protein n=1 Tax=Demequina subtropica TaxID=1638989 RepID=UPI00078637EC|nr:FUSC family protein [Demequina subtropica]
MADDARTPRRRGRAWAGGAGRAVASLGAIEPFPDPRWQIALQAAIATAAPVAVGVAVGHADLGLIASTGGFTTLYASWRSPIDRVRLLPFVAAVLTLSAALGTLTGPSPVAASIGLMLVAVGVAAIGYGYSLGPPGPLFPMLAYGLAAHVSELEDGARIQEPGVVIGAIGAGAAFAWLVAAGRLLMPQHRRMAATPLRVLLPGPTWDTAARELLLRASIVAVVGTTVSYLVVDPGRAYWTVGAGLAVVGARPGRGRAAQRGVHRIVGTIAGAALYVAAATLTSPPPWVLVLIIGALQFAAQMLVVRNYALALTFITPTVLIIVGAARGDDPLLAVVWERVLDTIVGGILGALTGLVHGRKR